ncbi:MAG: DUF3616 domain-containing protein [Kofleriaceae bacterium]
MRKLVLVVVAACGPGGGTHPDARTPVDGATDGGKVLDPTPGAYRLTCDGSGAVALDGDTFLDINDENQGVRVYRRAEDGPPSQVIDLSAGLGLAVDDEGDLEDLARIDDRVYVIASHGRNKTGKLRLERHRFAGLDLTTTLSGVGISVAGYTSELLPQLLDAANWETPDRELIAALEAASRLDEPEVPELAPEIAGTNIEAIAIKPNGELVIGFRNPRAGDQAIVVTLTHPSQAILGATAKFGGAAKLELGGLGLRGMTYSPAHGAILIIAGSHASGGPFKLFRWSGELAAAPTFVTDIATPADSAPEAIVAYDGTTDVQIVFDQGDALIGGTICKDAPVDQRVFTDLILPIE